jgi:hypothetical protein
MQLRPLTFGIRATTWVHLVTWQPVVCAEGAMVVERHAESRLGKQGCLVIQKLLHTAKAMHHTASRSPAYRSRGVYRTAQGGSVLSRELDISPLTLHTTSCNVQSV